MKNFKRAIAFLLAAMLVVTAVPVVSFAQEPTPAHYSDFPTGWSKAAMESAVLNSLIHGFGDGTVRPQSLLTRAEMAAIINRAFGAETKADIEQKYHDVLPEHWFYDDISKAVKMKTFEGMSSTIMNPDAPITRQDAMLVIARALVHSTKDTSVLEKFTDKSDIADYAANEIAALVGRGYVNGYGDGTLLPKNNITREEFAQMMHNIFVVYDRRDGEFSLGNIKGNVILTGDHIFLKDTVIEGDLIIGDGVHDTTVEFDGVKVTGRIIFRGGSAKVYFDGFELGGLLVTNDMNEDIYGPIYFYHYSYEEHFEDAVYNTSAKFIDKTIWAGSASGLGLSANDTAGVDNPKDAGTGTGTTTGGGFTGSVTPPSPGTPVTYTVQFAYNTVAGESYAGAPEALSVTVNQNSYIPATSFPTITKAHHDQKTDWYADANGNKKYDSDEAIVNSSTAINSNLVLRPLWDVHHKILLEIKDMTTGAPSVWELYVDDNGAIEAGQTFPKTAQLPQASSGEVKGWFQDLDEDGIKDDNEPYIAKGTDDSTASGTVTNNFVNMPINGSTSFIAYKEYTVTFTYSDEGNVIYTTTHNNVPHGSTVDVPTETECPGADWYDGANKITTATIQIFSKKDFTAATRMLKVTFYDLDDTGSDAGYVVVGGPVEVPYGTNVNQVLSTTTINTIRTDVTEYVANNTNIHSEYPLDYTHKVSYEWYRATRSGEKFTLCDRITNAGHKVVADTDFYYLKANVGVSIKAPSIINLNRPYNVGVSADSKTNLAATVLDMLYDNGLKTAVDAFSEKAYNKLADTSVKTNFAGFDISYTPFTKVGDNLGINNVTYKYKLLDFLGADTVDTLIEDSMNHMLDDKDLRHDIIVELLKQIAQEGETHGTDGELITRFDNIMMADDDLLAKIKEYAKDYAKTSADYVNTTYIGQYIEEELENWIDDFIPENSFEGTAKDKAGEFAAEYVENNYYATIENAIISEANDYAEQAIAENETEIKNNIKIEFIKKALSDMPDLSYAGVTADLAGFNTWWNHSETTDNQRTEYTNAENSAYAQVTAAIKTEAIKAVNDSGIIGDIQAQAKALAVSVAKEQVNSAFISSSYETVKTNALANLKQLQSYKDLPAQVVAMLDKNSVLQEVVYSDNVPLGTLDINFTNIAIDKDIAYNKSISFSVNVPVNVKIDINGTPVEASTTVSKSFSDTISGTHSVDETFTISRTIDLEPYGASYSIEKSWVYGKIDAKVESIFANQVDRRTEIIKLAGNAQVREEIDAEIDSIIEDYGKDSDIMLELLNVANSMYQTQIDAFKASLENDDQFAFDKDDAFIVDAMYAKLKTVEYKDYKNNFPQTIRTLFGGDDADGGELKVIFDNALASYLAQVERAYNGINEQGYNGTPVYEVDTFVMVSINPVDHVIIPAFDDYVENKLITKLDSNSYWHNNPYTDMFEDKLTYTMFVTADPAYSSGYRLNSVVEIYDEIYKVAVLTHDVGKHFIENITEAELDLVIDFAADAISSVYEELANKITVLSGGTPVKIKNQLMSLIQKFMGKDTGKLWSKTLLDAVPYMDIAYVKAINKVISVLGFDPSKTITLKVEGTSVQLEQDSKDVTTKSADEIADAIVSAGLGTKTGNGVVSVSGKDVNIGNIITKLSDNFGSEFDFVAEDLTEAGKAHTSADYLCSYKITLNTASGNENFISFQIKRG